MRSKGISPIIASVLLLAVSLAVVGIFSGWAPGLAQDVTQETRNSTMETLDCNEAGVSIKSAFYNDSANDTTVAIRNTGPEDLPDMTLAAYDSNDQIIDQKTGLNYTSGSLNDTVLGSVDQEPSYVEIYSTDCSSVTDRQDDITT